MPRQESVTGHRLQTMEWIVITLLIVTTIGALLIAARLNARLAATRREADMLRDTLDHSRESDERFQAIAAEALRRNSADLTRQSAAGLSAILSPLRDNLSRFEKTITESYSREARERFALDDKVRQLIALNQSVGEEARRLSQALSGNNRVQGDWGEMILENLLTSTGLQPDKDFVLQQSVTAPDGSRLRPDAILNLPDRRHIVIDSKVSMTAYFELINAETPEQISEARKALLTSVKNHIAELRNKKYHDAVSGRSIDFVLMFIPHEGAYLAAVDADPDLCTNAFASRVLPVSPTHLMAVLSLVDQIWRREKQDRNAAEIAAQAGKMLDKFNAFISDLEKIDRGMRLTRDAYDSAMNKLRDGTGNLMSRAEKLRQLGAKGARE